MSTNNIYFHEEKRKLSVLFGQKKAPCLEPCNPYFTYFLFLFQGIITVMVLERERQ